MPSELPIYRRCTPGGEFSIGCGFVFNVGIALGFDQSVQRTIKHCPACAGSNLVVVDVCPYCTVAVDSLTTHLLTVHPERTHRAARRVTTRV